MNELLAISPSNLGNETVQTVNAREMWKFLASKQEFSNWIKNRIEQYDCVQGIDYIVDKKINDAGQVVQADYFITLDMAKEFAMVERNDKGKEARKYFIECERKLKNNFNVPTTLSGALRLAAEQAEQIEVLQLRAKADAPKVEFALAVRRMEGSCKLGDFGKAIGIGRNTLFAKLRADEILMADNMPYQSYIDRELFVVIEQTPYTDRDGNTHPTFTTMVTGKGQVFLYKKYRKPTTDLAAH